MSLDKCSHQGSAHWQQYALHSAPSHQGVPRRNTVEVSALRSDGVPPTHWVAHQGRYHVHGGGQEDASSWGNPPDTYDNLLPAEEVIFQLSIDELGTQVANTKKFGTRYSICSKKFQIALIIMMQMTRFKTIFNFLVKVKWECATTHIPECT